MNNETLIEASLMQVPKQSHKSLNTFKDLHKVPSSNPTRSQRARGLVYPQALFLKSMRPTCNRCRQSQNPLGELGGIGKV